MVLRELTRDEKQFPLVVRENTEYGFRRDVWGRKRYGIVVALIALVAAGALVVAAAMGHEVLSWKAAALAAAFAAAALVVWLTVVTSYWVRQAADAYATRLIDSAVVLPKR
jgi:hypothetical protein